MESNTSFLLGADPAKRGREQSCAQLLAQRMAKLPPIPKKVVALFYYENMQLAEIAAWFGLGEDKIRQILLETLEGLRTYLSQIS